MSDTKRKKLRKQENAKKAIEILKKQEIPFEDLNNGVHLRIMDEWDFWPTTGKYMNIETKIVKRGIYSLIKEIEEKYSKEENHVRTGTKPGG